MALLVLLQGLLPTCVGYGLEGAIKFGSYEVWASPNKPCVRLLCVLC